MTADPAYDPLPETGAGVSVGCADKDRDYVRPGYPRHGDSLVVDDRHGPVREIVDVKVGKVRPVARVPLCWQVQVQRRNAEQGQGQ
jgi:hypothetical protein